MKHHSDIMTMTARLLFTLLVIINSSEAFAPLERSCRTSVPSSLALNEAKDANLSPEEREVAFQKSLKAMTAFTNKYLKNTDTKLCTDLSVPSVVIKGLAEHKVSLGTPLCPCRFYDDKEKEAKDGYWNCPCVPMRERHECHCMLFLTDDNAFAGDEQSITIEDVQKNSQGMQM